MAISGLEVIGVGLANEALGSDSLYVAFNKTKNNFAILANTASPYNTFNSGNGIAVLSNSTAGTVTITTNGVTGLVAGTGIVLSGSNGNVTISSSGGNGNGSGTVTSVGVSSGTLTVTNSPIVSNGTIAVELPTLANVAGTYTAPTVTLDQYGRVTNAVSTVSVGTVTSIGVTPGAGIQVSGSPITSNGNISITNTGVTRLTAGTGISLSGGNGNITVSAITTNGTVTSVGVTSSTLTITSSPVTTSGNVGIEIPNNISLSGNIQGGNLVSGGKLLLTGSDLLINGAAANLLVTASYFSTTTSSTATLAAGSAGQIKTFMMESDSGDMVITVANAGWKTSGTGTITFNNIGEGCTLQYVNNKWYCIGSNGVVFA